MMKLLSVLIYSSLRVYNASAQRAHDLKWLRKIKRLLKARNAPKLSTMQLAAIKKFYAEKNIPNIKTYWHNFYATCNGHFSTGYIPENLYYSIIEPKLNDRQSASVLMDKNLLEKLFPNAMQPGTVVKNINGFFFNDKGEIIDKESVRDVTKNYDMVFIKPTLDTGGGKNVSVLNFKDKQQNTEEKEFSQLLDSYGKNFILQQKVEQHEIMADLNPTSLNTFRVMSYLRNTEVMILSIIVRMGREGAITDNSTTGGISCGVKSDGSLNAIGYQLSGEKFHATSTGIEFEKIHLPFLPKIHTAVQSLHKEVPYFQIISWDFAVDKNGEIVLIELNIKGQDITFHQLNNGSVLAPLLDNLYP